MATVPMSRFLRRLTRGMAAETLGGLTDRQLLERLMAAPDEAVFEALVRRHGPMVYRVCRRVLQRAEDAEDAFQATFLLLARKLQTVRNRDSLASWLHGVAHRVALDARARDARRRRHEARAAHPQQGPPAEITWDEWRTALDAELGQLPEQWRLPLIVCYLEGRTQDEAARDLGWSKSTLLRRLGEARAALARRLGRRGVVWPAALATLLLSEGTAPAAPAAELIGSTVEAAAGLAAVPARVAALTEGVLQAMMTSKLKVIATVFVLAGVLMSGAWGLVAGMPGTAPSKAGLRAVAKVAEEATPRPALVREIKITQYVGTVALSPNGKVLATQTDRYKMNPAGPDFEIEASTIQVWDVTSGKELLTLGEVQDPTSRLLAVSEDGKSILVVDRPGRMKLRELQWYDVKTGEKKQTVELDARVGRLTLAPDGKRFASAFAESTPKGKVTGIHLGDLKTGKVSHTLHTAGDLHRGLAFSPDGKSLASVALGNGQMVHVWDLATMKVKQRLEGADSTGFVHLASSPDNKILACAGGGPELQRWDLTSGKALPAFAGNGRRTNHVEFSADGKLLLCAGWGEDKTGGEVVLLDARTGEKIQTAERTSGAVFARGRPRWAIASQDRGVKVWGRK